jgi:hypothetical protein
LEDFSGIINWKNLLSKSEDFQSNQPFKFGFIENIFETTFYNKLYESYPSLDTFENGSDWSKSQLVRRWGNTLPKQYVDPGNDSTLSEEWNRLKQYAESDEFIENFRKFSGTRVNKLQMFHFLGYTQGGFQLPHIHNVGPNTLVLMFYFSKGWKKGQSGGTYMASEVDESKIIFEPYNLDNTLALFQDGPKAAHGTRVISENVERRALQITLEEWSDEDGWSSEKKLSTRKKI